MRYGNRVLGGAVAALVMVAATGCAEQLTPMQRGVLMGTGVGAGLGAGAGAAMGAATGDAGPGAAIGAGMGALAGGAYGYHKGQLDQRHLEQEAVLERQRQEIARNQQLIDELRRRRLDVRETSRGVVVNLPDVLFKFARADLTSEAERHVRDIAHVLEDGGGQRPVSIEGHTDSIGNEGYNLRLSEARASTVARQLESDGVAARRLSVRGFGESRPVAPNTVDGRDNPTGRAKNRRVEVVIENERSAPTPERRTRGRRPADVPEPL